MMDKVGSTPDQIDRAEERFLADGVKRIIVETDEKKPTTVARIEDTPDGALYPEPGYRVRVKFKD